MTTGNGESLTTAAWNLKNGMYLAAKAVFDASTTYVVMGEPSTYPDEIVSIASTSTTQAPATLGTNRAREETLQQVVTINVFTGGADDSQPYVEQRAFELLQMLEAKLHYIDPSGVDGTTLGGAVRECFLTDISQESAPVQDGETMGRECALTATFTAKARIGR